MDVLVSKSFMTVAGIGSSFCMRIRLAADRRSVFAHVTGAAFFFFKSLRGTGLFLQSSLGGCGLLFCLHRRLSLLLLSGCFFRSLTGGLF